MQLDHLPLSSLLLSFVCMVVLSALTVRSSHCSSHKYLLFIDLSIYLTKWHFFSGIA